MWHISLSVVLCTIIMEVTPENKQLTDIATKNIGDIVSIALEHRAPHKALVIYDTENELTRILTAAYRNVLPDALFLDFNTLTKDEIIAQFDALSPRDLVVLIQSSDFRLNQFRDNLISLFV